MKGGKMDKKQLWAVVGIAVVVALAVSVVAAGITGGVIKVYDYNTRTYSDAYTKQEIDSFNMEIDNTITRIYTMIEQKNSEARYGNGSITLDILTRLNKC